MIPALVSNLPLRAIFALMLLSNDPPSHVTTTFDDLAGACKVLGTRGTAIGEQAVVPDAVEPLRQHVQEGATSTHP